MMTREDIERTYNVRNGRIASPGKFEGEMLYVPYFWEVFLNGFADRDNGDIIGFDIVADDIAMFPELRGRRTVRLRQDSNGFVYEI